MWRRRTTGFPVQHVNRLPEGLHEDVEKFLQIFAGRYCSPTLWRLVGATTLAFNATVKMKFSVNIWAFSGK
jgi:hypothetical protein